MKVVGLTGGIGSGKSTIREWFSSQGVPCFDSDTVGKELLNSSLKEKIIQDFGSHFYSKEGKLDRARLAALVFSDSEALKKLNSIVHPAVAERAQPLERAEIPWRRILWHHTLGRRGL